MDAEERALVYQALARAWQAEFEQALPGPQGAAGEEGVVVVDDAGRVIMMNSGAEALYGVKLMDAAGKPLAIEPMAEVRDDAGHTVGKVAVVKPEPRAGGADRDEREFVAHVTHELRAPLSSIRAALELIEFKTSGKTGSELTRLFSSAIRNTERLDGLIRSILDFSKIESGQMTVHPEPTDPSGPLREAAETMRPWCSQKGVELAVDAGPGLAPVMADPARTVQVVVNFLSNAIKFTPRGGRITASVAGGSGDLAGFAVFSVSDTGPGISREDQAKVFDKFVQVGKGEKLTAGVGLGLAIAKALVELQKGRIWLESEPGKGATFRFSIPFAGRAEPRG